MKEFLIILLVLSSFSIPFAQAHPFTEQTVPSSTANAPEGTSKVIVYFSEPIELNFSTLRVIDSTGEQIDNRDTSYHEGESSLVITTPPLSNGVYTVTTKVLSKIDGHLIPDAFLFGVGDAVVVESSLKCPSCDELIFLPEAGSRFPGHVGQTIVLGAVIASLIVWRTQNKQLIIDEIKKVELRHHRKFIFLTGIGVMLIFLSNILMIAVQTVRLEAALFDAIQTTFGMTWMLRMGMTVALLGIWFTLDRKKILGKRDQIVMLAVMLVLIGTSSMIGHGAASGETLAVILDYIHNLVAAIWIGGIFYFVFTLLPTLSQLKEIKREKMALVLIPRFSITFVIAIGVVIITGPTLLWFLESDVGLITESVYGQLIILKIVIAAAIIGFGGFIQFRIQRNAEKSLKDGKIFVYKKLKRTLKIDAVLGVILLGVVALLINGTLPAGEIQKVDAQEIRYGFSTVEFSKDFKFDVEILPFSNGENMILVKVSDFKNIPLYDLKEIKVKVSNPLKNISSIPAAMEEITGKEEEEDSLAREFQGEITFGFSGQWQVEVEAQRTENANESIILDLNVKPRLADIQTKITEYELPDDAAPLFPVYHEKTNSIWISDSSAPRLWQFLLDTKEFVPYTFEGLTTTFLSIDSNENIWFVDTPANQIGYIDSVTKQIITKTIPKLDPTISKNTPTYIQADFDGNIWISITNKAKILKYIPEQDLFREIALPSNQSLPFALAIDRTGDIWYTVTEPGGLGFINTQDYQLTQIPTDAISLESPEYIMFDENGDVWISEHTGLAITKFNPVLESFQSIIVPDEEALPFGMTFDRYGNIWFAQHAVDSIGVYDPDNDDLMEIPVPTETSFVQFMASDGNDNVWFVEQRGNKIATVSITEIPVTVSQIKTADNIQLKYTEITSPLIALGIIATSLFYVKSIQDKRRLNSLINS